MSWEENKVFTNVDEFIEWLDKNFGEYISNHISDNHVHHTWRPNHESNKKIGTLQLHKNMKKYHVDANGWDDIAQHITIGYDGMVVLGRDIKVVPVSAKGYNGTTNLHPFAYEMIGDFDKGNDVLEGKQLEVAIKISRYFYKKGKGIVFHRECLINGRQPKTCPGTGISKEWFMGLVKDSKFDVGKTVNVVEPAKTEVKAEIISAPSKPVTSASNNYKGKRLECIYKGKDGLNFYSKASWDKKYKVGVVTYGIGFPTIVDKVKVDGSYMYKVKNSKGDIYYITASSEYVNVEGEAKKMVEKKPAPKKEKAKTKKKYVELPASDSSWRVYPINKACVKGNEKGYLNPKKFKGLSYEVLDNPSKDIYTIKTSDFGKVNIYAAKSTGAKIVTK